VRATRVQRATRELLPARGAGDQFTVGNGAGDVLAVFVRHVGLGHLELQIVEEWQSSDEVRS